NNTTTPHPSHTSLKHTPPPPLHAILVDNKTPHRKKIETAILSLQKQSRIIDQIAKTWGLELNVQSE
ncbi:MAG: hypothetical protein ACK5P7_04430, partial [Bdellovibrio sp.]